jgi:hypothetical protein
MRPFVYNHTRMTYVQSFRIYKTPTSSNFRMTVEQLVTLQGHAPARILNPVLQPSPTNTTQISRMRLTGPRYFRSGPVTVSGLDENAPKMVLSAATGKSRKTLGQMMLENWFGNLMRIETNTDTHAFALSMLRLHFYRKPTIESN